MKNKMQKILLSLFMVAIFSSCVYTQIDGSGNVIKEDRTVPSFTGLDVKDGIDVILSQGSSHSVTIEADENLLEILKTEVSGGVLKIYIEKNVWKRTTLKAYVTVTELSSLSVSGGGDVSSTELIEVSDLKIGLSGGGDLAFVTKGNNIKMDISGGGDAKMEVEATKFSFGLSGGGDISLSLKGKELDGTISGGGDAGISLGNKLDLFALEISGGGDLELDGSAGEIKVTISGGGDVEIDATENAEIINLGISGGGNIEMSASTGELQLDISGGGNAELKGSARTMKATCKSGGDLYAEGYKVENAVVTLSGGSDAKLFVTGELEVNASGGGHVYVAGNPHVKEGNMSGGSKLHMK